MMTKNMDTFEVFTKKRFNVVCEASENRQREAGKRLREVLIVDDEEPLLLSIADGLSIYRKFFNLQTATNGADAVKVLKSSPVIDLVVTDLSMPKMDGFELLAYINRNYPRIPVILMTAFGTPKIEEIVNNMGLFRYLEKPLDINVIAENIFAALKINAMQPLGQASFRSEGRQAADPEFYPGASGPFANFKKTMP